MKTTTPLWTDDELPSWSWYHAFSACPEADTLTDGEDTTTSLLIADVQEREDIFQTRQFRYTQARSIQHVKNLTGQLRARKRLRPIWVWKAGGRFIVIDGHHRLAAYQTVAKTKKAGKPLTHIPVKVFTGSKQAAYEWAVSQNVEDKENMNFDDKMEAGWRWTVSGLASLDEIAAKSGISVRTASTMRARLKQARTLHPLEDFRTWTWAKIKSLVGRQPLPEELAAREEAQVIAYVQGLAKMKTAPVRKARLMAQALRRYDAQWADTVAAENQKLRAEQGERYTEATTDQEEDEF